MCRSPSVVVVIPDEVGKVAVEGIAVRCRARRKRIRRARCLDEDFGWKDGHQNVRDFDILTVAFPNSPLQLLRVRRDTNCIIVVGKALPTYSSSVTAASVRPFAVPEFVRGFRPFTDAPWELNAASLFNVSLVITTSAYLNTLESIQLRL